MKTCHYADFEDDDGFYCLDYLDCEECPAYQYDEEEQE